jgi:peptide/nickel transport system substrate-binding protein
VQKNRAEARRIMQALGYAADRRLAVGARPIIYRTRAATRRQPYVKGFDSMVNSVYNGWRFGDLWLDR